MWLRSPEALRWASLPQNMLTGTAYCLQSNGISDCGHNTQSSKVVPLTGDNTWYPWTSPFHPEYLGASSRERIVALTIITLILDKFLRYFHMHHCQLVWSRVCDGSPVDPGHPESEARAFVCWLVHGTSEQSTQKHQITGNKLKNKVKEQTNLGFELNIPGSRPKVLKTPVDHGQLPNPSVHLCICNGGTQPALETTWIQNSHQHAGSSVLEAKFPLSPIVFLLGNSPRMFWMEWTVWCKVSWQVNGGTKARIPVFFFFFLFLSCSRQVLEGTCGWKLVVDLSQKSLLLCCWPISEGCFSLSPGYSFALYSLGGGCHPVLK